jgi:quinol monooxygenase YgiN
MLVVHVHVHVKPDFIEAFKKATIENARNSIKEPGVERFDVFQAQDEPTHFILEEIYRTADAPAKHKETAHYARWRDTVVNMMAEPRSSEKFAMIFPIHETMEPAV